MCCQITEVKLFVDQIYPGTIKVVNQYSFPKGNYFHKHNPIYETPQQKVNSVIQYSNGHGSPNQLNKHQSSFTNTKPNGESINHLKVLSSDLYSMGMTVLDCMILERGSEPEFQTFKEKTEEMKRNPVNQLRYSDDLKCAVLTLLNENYQKRPNPHELLAMASLFQNKFKVVSK